MRLSRAAPQSTQPLYIVAVLVAIIAAGPVGGLAGPPAPMGKQLITPFDFHGVTLAPGWMRTQVDDVRAFLSQPRQRRPAQGFPATRRKARARQRLAWVVQERHVPCIWANRFWLGAALRRHRRPGLPREGQHAHRGMGQMHRARRLFLLLAQAQRPALYLRQDDVGPVGRIPLLRKPGGVAIREPNHRLGDQEPFTHSTSQRHGHGMVHA